MEPNVFNNSVASLAGGTKVLLDGTNYVTWKQSMVSVLQSKGLYKFITPRAADLKQKARNDGDLFKEEELLEGDEKALGLIKCHILQSYIEVVTDCNTALEAWKKIQEFFDGKETFNKIHLLEQLIDGKFIETSNPTKDVQDFVSQKNELVRRLKGAGITIAEELQVAIMLARLPESYDMMRRILESSAELNLLQLTAELNREAIRRSTKKRSVEAAAMVATDDLPMSRNMNGSRPLKKRRTNDTRNLQCTYCKKNRHVAADCWLNPDSAVFKPEMHQQLLDIASRTTANQQHRTGPPSAQQR